MNAGRMPGPDLDQGQLTTSLTAKFGARTAALGVIGMGYVGLPTMVAAAEAGFQVTGIDMNADRVSQVNAGTSYIEDVGGNVLQTLVGAGKISATNDYAVLRDLDVVLVCVPTPLTKNKEPDLAPMEVAIQDLAANLRPGQLVILQSTSFPGTTQEFVLPRLEQSGLRVGHDFYLAFALERVDPGNAEYLMTNVPKVVGGITSRCTEVAVSFLSTFVHTVVPVSTPKVAEMTKLLENTFRSVNIALVNELAMLCQRMDIDIWEVIEAASTKPFGFMPFYPGPGVGGHCIPVDPFYLSWKAKEHDFYVNFIQLAAEVNENMPRYTLLRISEILGARNMALKGSRMLVLGVTFKENINDTRNAPAGRVIQLLLQRGVDVTYNDRHVPDYCVDGRSIKGVELDPLVLQGFDAAVILVGHSYYDWSQVVDNSKLVIDTKNATRGLGPRPNVVKL